MIVTDFSNHIAFGIIGNTRAIDDQFSAHCYASQQCRRLEPPDGDSCRNSEQTQTSTGRHHEMQMVAILLREVNTAIA
jgi:hypothetical protein